MILDWSYNYHANNMFEQETPIIIIIIFCLNKQLFIVNKQPYMLFICMCIPPISDEFLWEENETQLTLFSALWWTMRSSSEKQHIKENIIIIIIYTFVSVFQLLEMSFFEKKWNPADLVLHEVSLVQQHLPLFLQDLLRRGLSSVNGDGFIQRASADEQCRPIPHQLSWQQTAAELI